MADAKDHNPDPEGTKKNAGGVTEDGEDYGYSLFPKREPEGGYFKDPPPSKYAWFTQSRTEVKGISQRRRCEKNVLWCTENDPMVQMMLGAMKKVGCPVDLSRHISCEECKEIVGGGFDPLNNQVVFCKNNLKRKETYCSVFTHELIHAYDKCRADTDLKSIPHLACSEIRAANLCHCSFVAAMNQSDASPINIKQRHQECVKSKALLSVVMARNVSPEEGNKIVESVFERCYNDLEPIGRRIRKKNVKAAERAHYDGLLHGFIAD